jgi:hypothetical protein
MTKIQFADESYKTKKVREKLKKHLEKIDSQITQQELNRKIVEIHRWIARHAPNRVSLKNKSISLFDENQNAAKASQKITGLINQLQKNIYATSSEQKA